MEYWICTKCEDGRQTYKGHHKPLRTLMENHHGSSLIAAPFPDLIYTTLKSWPESEEFNHYCRVFFKFVQMPSWFQFICYEVDMLQEFQILHPSIPDLLSNKLCNTEFCTQHNKQETTRQENKTPLKLSFFQ